MRRPPCHPEALSASEGPKDLPLPGRDACGGRRTAHACLRRSFGSFASLRSLRMKAAPFLIEKESVPWRPPTGVTLGPPVTRIGWYPAPTTPAGGRGGEIRPTCKVQAIPPHPPRERCAARHRTRWRCRCWRREEQTGSWSVGRGTWIARPVSRSPGRDPPYRSDGRTGRSPRGFPASSAPAPTWCGGRSDHGDRRATEYE